MTPPEKIKRIDSIDLREVAAQFHPVVLNRMTYKVKTDAQGKPQKDEEGKVTPFTPEELQAQQQRLSRLLQGTDMVLDPKDGQIYQIYKDKKGGEQKKPVSLFREISFFYEMLKLAGEDRILQREEVERSLSQPGSPPISTDALMEKLQYALEKRYQPLKKRLANLKAHNIFDRLVEELHDYNKGLYDEEMTRAHGTLRTGGGFKAAANIVGTQFSLAWWPIEWALDKTHIYEEKPAEVLDPTTEEKEKSFYLPDRFAHDKAYHGYQERKAAIETLTKAVKAGLDKEETWAVTLDVEETLKKLDPKIQEILQVNLDLKAKWEIVKKTDVKEQEKARLEYAKAEQQWWLDFGGGNATSRNWSNWTGGINNFKYAVGELNYLASKATDPEVKENARNALAAMGYGTDDTDTWYEAIFFGKHYNSEQESRLFGRTLNYGLMAYFGRGPIHTTRTRFGEGIKWTGRGLGNMSKAGTKAVIGEERATRWGEAIVESRLGDAGRGIKRGMESLGKRWENRKWFRLPFKDARQRFAQKHPKLSGDWKIFDGFLSLALTDQLLDPEPYKPINTWNRNVDRTPWPDPEVLSPEEQNFENRTLGKATNK